MKMSNPQSEISNPAANAEHQFSELVKILGEYKEQVNVLIKQSTLQNELVKKIQAENDELRLQNKSLLDRVHSLEVGE